MSLVKSLALNHFRNYTHSQISDLGAGFVVLTGANGAGKTNCLEAVSLLAPGRGLRGARPQEWRQSMVVEAQGRTSLGAVAYHDDGQKSVRNAGDYGGRSGASHAGRAVQHGSVSTLWTVRADILSSLPSSAGLMDASDVRAKYMQGEGAAAYGQEVYSIATGENPQGTGRIAKLNGEKISALSHLSDVFSCVWFTPAMSGLFMEGASGRRRFFDRLVFAYDPSHAGRLRRYEKALSERSRILKDAQNKGERPNATWLDGVEMALAETSVALAASRLELLEKLQGFCRDVAGGVFPPLAIDLTGGAEERLMCLSALAVEDQLKESFRQNRTADSYTGGSATAGAHRSDMQVIYLDKNMPADQCSTGEQKALLLTIILAHACFMHGRSGMAPVLLLDEITAHLDERRRLSLFDILDGLQGQVWMSGTEKELFQGTRNTSFIHVRDNVLRLGA